ncbi:succinylglutamate desuccinylase/aspartoacylase family protein [bacterium]|nr:succinylglutamate desuccinylase/aspartoacylase family protein [bacterium]
MVKAKVRHLPVKIKDRPEFNLAYWEIDSGNEGPCLLVTAALHGNEVQGSEVIRRFCPIAEKEIVKGKMVLVPFANPLAVWNRRPHIVSTLAEPKGRMVERVIGEKKMVVPDRRDNLNCTWPGNPEGNESEQMSYILFNGLVQQATHNIDLHCWNKFWATSALPIKTEESLEFAKAGAYPFVIPSAPLPKDFQGPYTLTGWFNSHGRVAFAVEFSGQYILFEKEINIGVRSLVNCSKYLKMFKGDLQGLDETLVVKDDSTKVFKVTAPIEGLFIETDLKIRDFVKQGTLLGYLFSDKNLETIEIKAPADGYLYSYGSHRALCDVDLAGMHPYSDKGDTLAIIKS